MRRVRAFGLFWWDFVIGDDWRMAAGVVSTLALTYGLSHRGVSCWWLPPIAVVAVLLYSVRRAAGGGERRLRQSSDDGRP